MKVISFDQLEACLYSRIAPSDFLAYDCSPLLDEEVQEKVVTILREILLTNCYYVRIFLARYMRILEENATVIEELYELYVDPQILSATELPATSHDLLKYAIDDKESFLSISETPRIISGAGTTGLRTWEAALFLSNYLNNTTKFDGKFKDAKILELGSGTGLVSLSLLKNYHKHEFKQIVITDGDSALLEKIPETLKLNNIAEAASIKIQRLIWGEGKIVEKQKHDSETVDTIVAADVTYDSSVVPQLCHELARFFASGATVAYVAATIRNDATIQVWESELDDNFFWSVCERLSDPHVSDLKCWFRKGTPEIRVYEITGLSRAFEGKTED